jgi:hypothetical protein
LPLLIESIEKDKLLTELQEKIKVLEAKENYLDLLMLAIDKEAKYFKKMREWSVGGLGLYFSPRQTILRYIDSND